MTVEELPFPLTGSTLITGPSGVGKTKLTYQALQTWHQQHPHAITVVFDFAPQLERGNRILGGRLTRFGPLPESAWKGIMAAYAPRAEGTTSKESMKLAKTNASNATRIFDAAPTQPDGVFVNDATIPFQHETSDISRFTAYCDRAQCSVINAFDSTELGTDNPVSTRESHVLRELTEWADRTITIDSTDT